MNLILVIIISVTNHAVHASFKKIESRVAETDLELEKRVLILYLLGQRQCCGWSAV